MHAECWAAKVTAPSASSAGTRDTGGRVAAVIADDVKPSVGMALVIAQDAVDVRVVLQDGCGCRHGHDRQFRAGERPAYGLDQRKDKDDVADKRRLDEENPPGDHEPLLW